MYLTVTVFLGLLALELLLILPISANAFARKIQAPRTLVMATEIKPTTVKFTRDTKVINIGHLPGHTKGKVDLLLANGFTDVSAILGESTPVSDIKATLAASPNSLFIVGGAMMQGFPELMADLLSFIESECPTIRVHKTVKPDFDDDVLFPPAGFPTEAQVNKSALNICNRLLGQDLLASADSQA